MNRASQEPVDSGEDLNPFYLPNFIHNHLLKLAKEFPLWTAATLPFYANHATSAPVEQTFDDLKNRVMVQFSRVVDAEKFIKMHLLDLSGSANIFSSNLLNFAMKHEPFPVPQPKKRIRASDVNPSERDVIKSTFSSQHDYNENNYENLKDESLGNDLTAQCDSHIQQTSWKNDVMSKQVEKMQDENFDKEDIAKEQDCSRITAYNVIGEHNYSFKSLDISTENNNINTISSENFVGENDSYLQSPLKMNLDDSDFFSVEDWRGKAKKSTIITFSSPNENNSHQFTENLHKNAPQIFQAIKQSSSTYFQEYPEIDLVNERIIEQVHKPTQKIVKKCESFNFLKNGSLLGPVTLDSKTVFILHTCAFDSISQILRAATIDDPNCAKIILDSSSYAFSKFVSNFATSTCKRQEMYQERAAILAPFYPFKKHGFQTDKMSQAFSLDAVDAVFALWKKLYPAMYSLTRKTTCDFCNYSMESHQHSVIPNQKLIKVGKIETLNEAIDFKPQVDVPCPRCHEISHVTIIPGKLIFVELDIRRSIQQLSGEKFKLKEFPTTLQFDVAYKLAGVIAFRPGHFMSYAKRLNGWVLYDDLKDKAERASDNVIVNPHGAIYYRSA